MMGLMPPHCPLEGGLPESPRHRPISAGDVLVHFDGGLWVISAGDVLTFGRSRSCDIALADDDHLSRRAGSLRVLGDCVMVRNESSRKPLVLRPPVGEDRVAEPGAAITSLPFQTFDVLLTGTAGRVVTIRVDAARLTPHPYDEDPTATGPATRVEPIVLTGTQQRVLRALCAPLLTRSGRVAAPATYAEIGRLLNRRPQYIRNVVKSLRETLAGYGVEGLVRSAGAAAHEDFRGELARWAIRSGWVTSADLVDDDD